MERCCSSCTYHLHRDPAVGLSACGRCVFHLRCTAALSTCERCCVPVGAVDTQVLATCNARDCTATGAVLCPACAARLAARFETQLCRMERLSRTSAIGWLTAFGDLKSPESEAVVSRAWDCVVAELRGDYRVCREDGLFVHFTTRLYQLSKGQVYGSISYTDLVAFLPSLPPAAVGALRRFVGENRRYWQEHPRTRLLVPLCAARRRRSTLELRGSTDLMDPADLVSLSGDNAGEMARMIENGTLHLLGREVFYYDASVAPDSAHQSRRRAKEWRQMLKRAGSPG